MKHSSLLGQFVSYKENEVLVTKTGSWLILIGLYHSPDGITNPKYKLLCFITTKFFCKEKNALAFNRDRCCHLALCLRLIPFHWTYWTKGIHLWAQTLKGETLKVVWSEFSTLSLAVFIMSVIAWHTHTCSHLQLKTRLRFCPVSSSLSMCNLLWKHAEQQLLEKNKQQKI